MARSRFGALALAAALLGLGGCGGGGAEPGAGRGVVSPSPAGRAAAVRLTATGDSLTGSDGDLAGGTFGPGTWLSHALGEGITWAGGWAVPGATTADMAAAVRPLPDADVHVVLAGTNDVALGVGFAETAANIVGIVETVAAPRVLVASVPPLQADPGLTTGYNARLAELAAARGWEFVDVAAGVRDGAGWAPGMTEDGVHPTAAGYRVIGEALRAAVLAGG